MLVSPVRFAGTTSASTTSFQDKIRQPQAFVQAEKPAAATEINGGAKKKGGIAKKIIGALAGAAIVATGLALGNKYGFFMQKEGGNAILNKVKGGLDVAGQFIGDKAGVVKDFVVSHLPKRSA